MDGGLQIAPAVEGDKPLLWTGLLGSSAVLELLRWAKSQQKNVVVVCPSESEAIAVYDQALFFHRSLSLSSKLSFYPARKTDFMPSQYQSEDIVDHRLSVLYDSIQKKLDWLSLLSKHWRKKPSHMKFLRKIFTTLCCTMN